MSLELTPSIDSLDRSDREIADFSALVRSSSVLNMSDDTDNRSLVSSPSLHDDETSGLILCEDPVDSSGDARDDDEEEEEEGNDQSTDLNFSTDYGDASSLVDDEDYEDNDELQSRDGGRGNFLMARIRANPSLSIATLFMGVLTTYLWTDERFRFIAGGNTSSVPHFDLVHHGSHDVSSPKHYPTFPAKALLGITIRKTKSKLAGVKGSSVSQDSVVVVEPPYDLKDFRYEKFGRNRTLLHWDEVVTAIEQTQSIQEDDKHENNNSPSPSSNGSILDLWNNISNWGPCYPRFLPSENNNNRNLRVKKELGSPTRNWTYIVQSNSDQRADENSIVYPYYKKSYHSSKESPGESLGGFCRPGFLIIGQGKCGTSSLYHYLTGHPRILPAKEKQIHYFRYHKSKPLLWYYSYFPTIESFLGRGALMTGEASPGYMPYPSVIEAMAKRLSPGWKPGSLDGVAGDGVDAWKGQAKAVRSLPKIIAIVRDPITRAISSYKYNYIEPAMKKLRAGKGIAANGERIPGRKSDRYYRRHHLHTFEDLAYAELAALRKCLAPGGWGEKHSRAAFGKRGDFFYDSIQRRNDKSSNSTSTAADLDVPPLIHLDGACYPEIKSNSVPRTQWKDLAVEHPKKVLQLPNLQLTQSIIGRGVYSLPLEWWYEVFSNDNEDHIHVVCNEDMANAPDGAMDDVTKFLGLPEFDFTNVTSVGRYNVGGHRGYDTITKSQDEDGDDDYAENPEVDSVTPHQDASSNQEDVLKDLVAISDALRHELIHFYHPFNERLFQLIGKRCPWNES